MVPTDKSFIKLT